MEFWRAGVIPNLVVLAVLLAVIGGLRRIVPGWARLGIPDSIAAGALGFVLGPSVLGIAPLDPRELELVVYHAFAIVFIAVGLQRAHKVVARGGARSLAFVIVIVATAQVLIGFAMLAWWALAGGAPLHPGFGFMLMLGFAQGPGQALSFGGAWEHAGMHHGAQIGLTFAALGFAACVLMGAPLVAFARRRGWVEAPGWAEVGRTEEATVDEATPVHTIEAPSIEPTTMEPLTLQLAAIGCVYATVFLALWLVTRPLPPTHPLVASGWGFHFLIGSALAFAVRKALDRNVPRHGLDDRLLARISVTAVDFTTAAALAAIELDVVGQWIVPILLVAVVGGLATLVMCLWFARRAFPESPFAHALVLFGTLTGTLPTGFAMLRTVDPELRGPVARAMVVGATASIPLGFPLFVGILPFTVARWPAGFWPSVWLPLALCSIFLAVLVAVGLRMTPFRALRPLASLWPPLPATPPRDR